MVCYSTQAAAVDKTPWAGPDKPRPMSFHLSVPDAVAKYTFPDLGDCNQLGVRLELTGQGQYGSSKYVAVMGMRGSVTLTW